MQKKMYPTARTSHGTPHLRQFFLGLYGVNSRLPLTRDFGALEMPIMNYDRDNKGL